VSEQILNGTSAEIVYGVAILRSRTKLKVMVLM